MNRVRGRKHRPKRKGCLMQGTIAALCSSVIDLAGEIGAEVTAREGDSIPSAEAVLLMREAQAALNKARDALHRAPARQTRH